MSENKHTKEFLYVEGDEIGYISRADDQSFGMFCPIGIIYKQEDARRIVACVNGLAHVSTEQLESGELLHLGLAVKDLTKQRDELLATLKSTVETIEWMRGCTSPADDEIEKAINEGNTVIASVKGIKLTDNE